MLVDSVSQEFRQAQGDAPAAAWCWEDLNSWAGLTSGEEITQRLLCSPAGTWAGMTWQLGSAGMPLQSVCTWPGHDTWASFSLVGSFSGRAFQEQMFLEHQVEAAGFL